MYCKNCGKVVTEYEYDVDDSFCEDCQMNLGREYLTYINPSYCYKCGLKLNKAIRGVLICEKCEMLVDDMTLLDFWVALRYSLTHRWKKVDKVYDGRIGRQEFGVTLAFIAVIWFTLAFIASFVISIVMITTPVLEKIIGPLTNILVFVMQNLQLFLIVIALGYISPLFIGRLKDTGRNPLRLLWGLSGIGVLAVIYWLCLPGDKSKNRYGECPVEPYKTKMKKR